MRRDQHIGHTPQRAVGWQGPGIDDVEAGTRELLGLQRGDRVLGDDAAAARY